jgi:cyclopropane fatty-acyl-phospholipid synthase-like methyltransferase
MTHNFSPADVQRYYDRNTSAFVNLGEGGTAIHRAVWGANVRTSDEAFRYVEDQIAERIQLSNGRAHIVDLGCGVGGSLAYLARRLPGIRGTGITLSPVQAQLAQRLLNNAGVSDRVDCVVADYCDLPEGLESADLAYAIESFVHTPDTGKFFEQCQRIVRRGGALVICDDFRRPTTEPSAAAAIERFKRGWRVNTLIDRSELRSLARETGFEHESTLDLSSFLELNRPRDRAIRALAAILDRLPFRLTRFEHLQGGNALQECLRRGWIGYDLAVFRRA